MRAIAWFVLVCALVIPRLAGAASGEGRLVAPVDGTLVDVPLEHTDVKVRVDGPVAHATVIQRFRNPSATKIEAVYLFPLPTQAAVHDFTLVSGTRRVRGQIQERAKAKQIYEAARKQGLVAALLTQERPNLFTQSVANLEPGAKIEVVLEYVQRLDYEDGGYSLVFPMVVGPRYLPAAWKARAPELQVPTLPAGMRSSHDIALAVEIDAGVAIENVSSPSHQVAIKREGQRARVMILPGDTIPNKDFVLRYQVAGDKPKVGVVAHRHAGDGSFLMTLQPPAVAGPAQIAPRELILVLDTSSSMRGPSLAKAKELIRRMLWTLRPDDTFQIVRFSDKASALGPGPIAAKPKNVEVVLKWLAAIEAGGGTEMIDGIATALAVPHDPLRLRLLAFITDGYVGNEDEILAKVGKQIGESRLFAFGVGTAVNRYLLEEMAAMGRGAVQFVRPDEDTSRAVSAFERRIDAPVLTDIAISWGGLAVKDQLPVRIPDLFVGQPLVLAGHYGAPGTGTVTVTGKQAGRPATFSVPVVFPDKASHPAIATLWARTKIAELSRAQIRKADPAVERAIVALSIEHRILSQHTAFVAVDDSRVTTGGDAKRVVVPVEVPDAARNVTITPDNGITQAYSYSGAGAGYGGSGTGYVGGGFGSGGSYYGTLGTGVGYGTFGGSGRLAPRIAALPSIQLAQPTVSGDLDKAIIRRYVKRQSAKLSYCFEKELLTKPKLEGTVIVAFTIDPGGKVVKSATMSGIDKAVDTCVAKVIESIEFPKAQNGGLVQVNYPLAFKLAESSARKEAIKELLK